MTDEEADETLRAAIGSVMGHPMVGMFVMVATVYDDDGDARIAIHIPAGMTMTEQVGLLGRALNRAKRLDAEGWEDEGE